MLITKAKSFLRAKLKLIFCQTLTILQLSKTGQYHLNTKTPVLRYSIYLYDILRKLQKASNVKGLSFVFKADGQSLPTSMAPILKAGFDLSNKNTKCKFYIDLRNFMLEQTFTYLINPTNVFGASLAFNPKTNTLEKYDFGYNTALAPLTNFGIKHESTNKKTFTPGKFFFYFFHNANAFQTVGAEFALDYPTRAAEARMAFQHKFDDTVSSKFKINNLGHIDALLKFKLSETTTAIVTSGMNIRNFYEQKVQGVPLGFSFDIKF